MVVCNTSILPPLPASCAVTPSAMHPYTPGICPLSPVSALPCHQRFASATIIPGGQMLASTPIPCGRGMATSPVLQCSQSLTVNTPVNCPPGITTTAVLPCNPGIPTTAILSCNPGMPPTTVVSCGGQPTATVIPYTQRVTSSMCNQGLAYNQGMTPSTVSTLIPTNQGLTSQVFTSQGIPVSSIIPCTQRLINASNLIPCSPGVCQVSPTSVLQGNVGMCPIPPPSILSSSPGVCQIPSNLCSIVTVPSWKQSYGMEQVWQCEFKGLFAQYSPHPWLLLPVTQRPAGVWNTNVDSAKVRFCCEDCGHGWTSMKGRVAFWFILNPASGEGVVCLKLYGQQCDRCKTGNYEPAMWYPEEVVKVLVNIYNKVGQVYYGFQQAPYHRARRAGKPRTPHNSDLCQACRDGVCSERK